MKSRQAALLGESIFSWTNRPVSVCWGCALKQHRKLCYRNPSTGSQSAKLRSRKHGPRVSRTDSTGHETLSTLSGSLRAGTPGASDARNLVTQSGGKPASIRRPPFSPELDMPYHSHARSKEVGRRAAIHESSNKWPEFKSGIELPTPSLAGDRTHISTPKFNSPQGEWHGSKPSKQVVKLGEDLEQQKLNAVLDYWIAQKKICNSKPVHGPPNLDATGPQREVRSGSYLGGGPPFSARTPKARSASQTHDVRKLHSSKLMPVENRRSIHTAKPRSSAAAPNQQSIDSGDLPASLLPRFEVGSKTPIREHLKLWQEQNIEEEADSSINILGHRKPGGVRNMLTRPADGDTMVDTMDNEENEGPWPEASVDHEGVTEVDSDMPFLRCGDLVEISPSTANQESVLAIFIRNFDTQAQFYTIHGKWIHKLARGIYFFIPGFVSRNMVAEILPYLPSEEVDEEFRDKLHVMDVNVPRELGSSIINRMREFFNDSEAAYRRHSSSLDSVHGLVAHETEVTYMTLAEIATKILSPTAKKSAGRPWPMSTLYALHRILLRNEFGFGVDRNGHRVTAQFEIRPKQEVQSVNQVRSWLREYQEKLVTSATTENPDPTLPDPVDTHPIAAFVDKARQLIIQSRENRVPTRGGNIGPSAVRFTKSDKFTFQVVSSIGFSENDKSIIRFFEVWAGYRSIFRHVPLNSLASMILRAIGMYEDYELDHPVGWLFLQELGVYAPWENRMILNHKLGLPGHQITPEADQLRLENIRVSKSTPTMEDTMKDLRQDWGDLEVFCVDDVDAREIDDGISVEAISGSESTYWVHVHVANPTAFISPESTLAKYADYLCETVYLPERIYAMLPPQLSRLQMSLAPDRPTLTFSAKVNMRGELLEAKITPAYIRNVTFCTPATVRKALSGDAQPVAQTVITVGGEMPKRGRKGLQQNLTESQKQKLRILRDLGTARRRQHELNGAVNVGLPIPDVVVYLGERQDSPLSLTSHHRGYSYKGDPIIQLRGDHFDPKPDPETSAASKLVPDIMILACEAAALWCKERNVPILYRATQHNPDYDPNVFRKEVMQPTIEKLGYLPLVLSFKYSRLLGRSLVSSTPRPHAVIGADQYTKCTSPLRRYGDLMVHWQVESALRHEAATGKSLVGSRDQSYLAFSKERLEEMIPRIGYRERLITGVKRHSIRHWTVQLLFRAFYFQEATLPETWECFIFSEGASKYAGMHSGILKELGIDVQVHESDSVKDAQVAVGDWWEVKILMVDAYLRAVTVEIVRLIKKGENYSF